MSKIKLDKKEYLLLCRFMYYIINKYNTEIYDYIYNIGDEKIPFKIDKEQAYELVKKFGKTVLNAPNKTEAIVNMFSRKKLLKVYNQTIKECKVFDFTFFKNKFLKICQKVEDKSFNQ